MFSGKKNECHFKTKETQAASLRPHFKFSIPLSAFLISWFLLILIIFWFPPRSETDSSPQTKFNHPEEFKFQSISTATGPVCNESFSIYVYDLPSKFNVKMLKHCRHLNIYTDMCPHVVNRGLGQPFLFAEESNIFDFPTRSGVRSKGLVEIIVLNIGKEDYRRRQKSPVKKRIPVSFEVAGRSIYRSERQGRKASHAEEKLQGLQRDFRTEEELQRRWVF
ncbi:hypothetical protein U1Q18_043575 [Sarracenia purpurea var. burkii]